MMKIAYYYTGMIKGAVCIIVPKKRGDGFLVSALGWHYNTEKYQSFIEKTAHVLGVMGVSDCDGYLSVELKKNSWEDGFYDDVNLVLDAIKDIHQHIEEFKELGTDDFFDLVSGKNLTT